MSKRHILIIGDVDSVKDYLDFAEQDVSMIVSEFEYNFMPSAIRHAAKAIRKVRTPAHFDATCLEQNRELILEYAVEIAEQVGRVDRVICTHEHTVLPAAMIRTRLCVPGLQEEQARALRNKNLMKEQISAHGIHTPKYARLEERALEEDIRAFLNEFGKIVIKPANQAASHGILVTDDAAEAVTHGRKLLQETGEVSLEQYMDLPVMHFDGMARDGRVEFLSVSKKWGNCYDYVNARRSMATVILNDPDLYRKARAYVETCLAALGIEQLVFHLELFVNEQGDFVFLEIAGRYPGAGISKLIRDVFGFHLAEAAYRLDCGLPVAVPDSESLLSKAKPTAMLLLPSPVKKSLVLRGISGLDRLPSNVVGSEFTGPGTRVEYSSIDAFRALARFYIADDSLERIENSVREIQAEVGFLYEESE